MDAAIAQALGADRTLVVSSRHRAAALQRAWARARREAGDAVWRTPEILSFEAWFIRQWRRAREAGGLACALQLLSTAQERRLWTQVLDQMSLREGAGEGGLRAHSASLMQAATRARRDLLDLASGALSVEERLLVEALAEV
ncbi:MAG: hypothetical protein LBE59_00855, partial [Nevskiaceae bacterium]|nr:hypothetical protein [Nevskiaceae bacterium]